MEIIITAVGPDHKGLANPIVHYVTGMGANISEIQMYDHREEHLFAMLLRMSWNGESSTESALKSLRNAMSQIAEFKELSIRVWSPDERADRPNIAICVTYRPEPPLAILQAINSGELNANAAVMIGNRDSCRSIAEENNIDWHNIGDGKGNADDGKMVDLFDEYQIDYVALARYMRVLPAESCWKYAGGRIINLHHGLLPGFPGLKPYHDAYATNMLTFGCTCHFIIPELDAGNQIINQSTLVFHPERLWKKSFASGKPTTSQNAWSKGFAESLTGKSSCTFIAWLQLEMTLPPKGNKQTLEFGKDSFA